MRGAEDDLADRRSLVVHEAGRRDEPRVVERVRATERDLLLRREEELDPRVLATFVEDAANRPEHDDDRRLVVRAEDRPGGIADDSVLANDRIDPRLGRNRVRVRAEKDRRPSRRPSEGCGSRCSPRRRRGGRRRRPRPTRARGRRGTRRRSLRRRARSRTGSEGRRARGRGRRGATSGPAARPHPTAMLRQWSARRERVCLNPVYPSPNVDWGYDVADHTAIQPTSATLGSGSRRAKASSYSGQASSESAGPACVYGSSVATIARRSGT